MSAIDLASKRGIKLHLVPARNVEAQDRERNSDCWPDWTTAMVDAEIRALADRNRPSVVLGEIIRALAITAGIVALIQIGVYLFHAVAG